MKTPNMETLINEYVEYNKNAWSEATKKSTLPRLRAVSACLTGRPDELAAGIAALAPSSRVTTWTQVTAFWTWLTEQGHVSGPNPYREWRRRNKNLFKNAFTKRDVGVSYEEAKARCEAIEDAAVRRRALEILSSGTRWIESVQEAPVVCGKGNKLRRVFRAAVDGPRFEASYYTFLRKLRAATGLKPHDLRALAATRFAEAGAKEADLMTLMGWSSIKTAAHYLQPKREAELADLAARAYGGGK